MGNKYSRAFKKGLQLSHIRKLNVADNRLNEKGTFSLVKGLNKHVQEIDMSNNRIGTLSIEHISYTLKIDSAQLDLRVIKFDNAGIIDSQVCVLIDSLMTCDKPHMIKELSLAMNLITDVGAEKIASFLEYSGSALKTLSLYWNKIKYRGGLKIAESISNNETLKVLDLSWNLIGKWQLNNLGQLPVSKIMKKLKNQPQQSMQEAYSKLNLEQASQIDE